uniref:GIR1-like zinc ribbon domain-containing protein n=1 Tax=Musa acuminata subsp. malaccensis TaxID=214687 RepID=A0A804JQS6_MUSAM
MLVEVSSREGERGPITLDLLGGCTSVAPKDVDAGSKPSFGCRGDLRPLDLNRLPDDGPKPVAAALAGSQSVCTIEKVKWALERAERESRGREMEEEQQRQRRRRRRMGASPSSSSSITTASIKRRGDGEEGCAGCDSAGGSLVAAGCPSCLSYVLISRMNPRCPRCDSQVAPPLAAAAAAPPPPQKRPRIDLNFALFPL